MAPSGAEALIVNAVLSDGFRVRSAVLIVQERPAVVIVHGAATSTTAQLCSALLASLALETRTQSREAGFDLFHR